MAHEPGLLTSLRQLFRPSRPSDMAVLQARCAELDSRLGQSERENVALREENSLLRAQVAAHAAREQELLARIAALEERLNTSSRNSSRPPSQDRPDQKPPRIKDGRLKEEGKRARGGQPGHKGKSRQAVPDERIDKTTVVAPPEACDCGGVVEPTGKPWVMDQAELPPLQVTFHRYVLEHGVCQGCGKVHRAPLPAGVVPGLLGVNLLAFVGLLIGGYQIGRRGVARLLSILLGLNVSLGALSQAEQRLSQALAPLYDQGKSALAEASELNLDETGSRRDGKRAWIWLAASKTLTVFLVHARRNAAALTALLGDTFAGIVTSDRWHTYNRFFPDRRQVCWAHLLRDFQKIADRGCASRVLGKELLEQAIAMFRVWGHFKDGEFTREQMRIALAPIRTQIEALLARGSGFTGTPKTAETCKNLVTLGPALWTFIEHEGVEPTNNRAERLIRNAVMWRNRSQGTWSDRGDRFLERILTVVVSLRLQRRNPLPWLAQALRAQHGLGPPPSLVS